MEDTEETFVKRRTRTPKSFYIRLVDFFRTTWTGVKFALDFEFGLEEGEEHLVRRCRPQSVRTLSRLTHFTEKEIKRIYRGFKNECPTGIVELDTFCEVYSQFFGNSSLYARYVFNTFDLQGTGVVSFQNLLMSLSVLSFGTLEEKLTWVFRLYDINGDGLITRQEMTDVVFSIFQLIDNSAQPPIESQTIQERVNVLFQKMDGNSDGMVSLEEFLEFCTGDVEISRSMSLFTSLI